MRRLCCHDRQLSSDVHLVCRQVLHLELHLVHRLQQNHHRLLLDERMVPHSGEVGALSAYIVDFFALRDREDCLETLAKCYAIPESSMYKL